MENKKRELSIEEIEERLLPGLVTDPLDFVHLGEFFPREYQKRVMQAVCRSVLEKEGRTFVVLFPRQSGKNELQAQIEAYLLYRLYREGAEMVKVSPTWKPQALVSMRRLEKVLRSNTIIFNVWRKESGYLYAIGRARIAFLSGAPEANIVGATASALLEVDEAQDVEIEKFDRDIAPMAASTNATRVFWGTAWTSQTLLARELEAARRSDLEDPALENQTAFVLTADEVAAEVPAYGKYVSEQVKKLGRSHPLIRTQYYSETIDGQGGMFPPERVRKMFRLEAGGDTPAETKGAPVYALLLDVGGEAISKGISLLDDMDSAAAPGETSASGAEQFGGRRDATALTVVAVDLSGLSDPALRAPVYRVVERRQWVGAPHPGIYNEIRETALAYGARYVVVDATGVGAGLASFLERALPGRVVRFLFTSASKSKLGWDFQALVDAGRWVEGVRRAELASDIQPANPLQRLFLQQLAYCQYEVLAGPEKTLRWGVRDGTRDPLSGAYIHDDLLISAALSAVLDQQDWRHSSGERKDGGIVRRKDPLEEMRGF
ncbi:MAG: hypothetical protein IH586_02560 [Anaerolineaceae bacterium]|nr:hypothetical protein [Anaerolineaceae bacterium]